MNTELQEKCERLFKRQRLGIKPGLDTERNILSLVSNPEREYPIIHIAGTNGKGSTAAMIHAMLSAAGYRVGLYTSPHLVKFNERYRVGNNVISDDDLSELIDLFENTAEAVADKIGKQPTFFECATAMAFEYFKRQQVDIAIIETGMGGRLDATNVVMPLISVITGISLEHTHYLGDSIAAVAGEKAGIIKNKIPVVIGKMDYDAESVIRQVVNKNNSECISADNYTAVEPISCDLSGQKFVIRTPDNVYVNTFLPLVGQYQLGNLAVAITVLDILKEKYKYNIPEQAIKDGLAEVYWPGRFQVLKNNPPVILDGAHNPEAAGVLADALTANAKGRDIILVVGMCGDKNPQSFFESFRGIAYRCMIVPLATERSMDINVLKSAAENAGMSVTVSDLPAAISESEKWAAEYDGLVCITGSLYLVGEVLGLFSCVV